MCGICKRVFLAKTISIGCEQIYKIISNDWDYRFDGRKILKISLYGCISWEFKHLRFPFDIGIKDQLRDGWKICIGKALEKNLAIVPCGVRVFLRSRKNHWACGSKNESGGVLKELISKTTL